MRMPAHPPTARLRPWSVAGWCIFASMILLLGCYRAPARAHPLPGALQTTTARSVREAAQAALATFNQDGINVEQYRPDTGLVESAWFDVTQLETRARDYPADERVVRFRFLAVADTAGGPTRVYLEVVQPAVDPMGGRRREREAPRDHPAMNVARRMMDRLEQRLGR